MNPHKITQELLHWTRGIRLYIGIAALLFTALSIWWAQSVYGGTSLFAIRLEQLYAWLGLGLIAMAVTIGPLCSVWSSIPGKQMLFDARRLLGVSAAWFSTLHVFISYGALFRFANPFTLPTLYQQAFAIGAGASLILLAMAFTSFDKAFHGMGIWWFRLHRFVYGAILLALIHAFMIGSHATSLIALVLLTIAGVFILGLHGYLLRTSRKPTSKLQKVTVVTIGLLLCITFAYGFNQKYNDSSGDEHTTTNHQESSDSHQDHERHGP